jgi:hypothetical protein
MIEVRDLRIGNILDYKGELQHVTSLSLDIDDEYQDLIGVTPLGKWIGEKQDWNRAFGDDLKSVPITEELLNKFGSLKFKLWQNTIRDGSGRYEGYTFVFQTEDEKKTYIKLEYVHQLQNLYHSLTGEELTIK